jgi:hypothetical protein
METLVRLLDVFDELDSVDPMMLPLFAVVVAGALALLIAVIVLPLRGAPKLSRDEQDLIRRWGTLR